MSDRSEEDDRELRELPPTLDAGEQEHISPRVRIPRGLLVDPATKNLLLGERMTSLPGPAHIGYEEEAKDLYGDHLERIWSSVHRDKRPDDDAWQLFRKAVLRVVDPRAMAVEAVTRSVADQPLPGDVSLVQLLASNVVRGIADAAALERFIREPLAETLARLEREEEGTREERTDIILQALGRIATFPGVGRLAATLAGYLNGQEERTRGYYGTMATISSMARFAGAADVSQVVRTRVLVGLWELAQVDQPADELGQLLKDVSTTSYNVAVDLGRALQAQRAGPHARAVLENLLSISAVTEAVTEAMDASLAERIVQVFDVASNSPRTTLTVIGRLGSIGHAWAVENVDVARFEAWAGIAQATGSRRAQGPTLLFNAGVTLARDARRGEAGWLRARMLLNALGLRIGMDISDSLLDAMTDTNGIDCAVNLVAALVLYKSAAHSSDWPALVPHVQAVCELSKWQPLLAAAAEDFELQADLVRLGNSAQELGAQPSGDIGRLAEAVRNIIEFLRGQVPTDPDPMVDAALLAEGAFSADHLGAKSDFSLRRTVEALVEERRDPSAYFVTQFADLVTDGPYVAAGMTTKEEWNSRQEIFTPRSSIVPALRGFTLED